ncbi:hypothetical protein ACFOEW_06870 [Alteromonas oceani]|uniref:Uncharacterized protein n=1 Tax=Alteromonas oceani TaxID=2071609 RepID=A0ABV7JXS2_9ALTE
MLIEFADKRRVAGNRLSVLTYALSNCMPAKKSLLTAVLLRVFFMIDEDLRADLTKTAVCCQMVT